jgi:hypothetical protein
MGGKKTTVVAKCLAEADRLLEMDDVGRGDLASVAKKAILDPARPYVACVPGPRQGGPTGPEQARRRAAILTDAAVREIAPMALDRDMPDSAAELRDHPPISSLPAWKHGLHRIVRRVALAANRTQGWWALAWAQDALRSDRGPGASVAKTAFHAAKVTGDDRPWIALRDALIRASCLDGVCCVHPDCRGEGEFAAMYPELGKGCFAGRKGNPAASKPHEEAEALVATLGLEGAREYALAQAQAEKKGSFWVEVLLGLGAQAGGKPARKPTGRPGAPKGAPDLSDPDAWAKRLLGWQDPKAPTRMVTLSDRPGGPGKQYQDVAVGQHAWLTPAQQAERDARGEYTSWASRHGWTPELVRLAHEDWERGSRTRGGKIPKEPHRVFYLGTHRAGWLAVEPGQDVPPEILAQWMSKARYPLFVSRRQLEKRKVLPRAAARWALDSGGFTEISKYGRWKLEAREYVGLVRRFRDEIGNMDWAAPMDWMCEVEMTAKSGLSRPQHIARSVASFVELRMLAPDLPFAPVLQGMLYEDYVLCVELFDRAGVDLRKEPVVGVGSICRRQEDTEALRTLHTLASYGLRLHGFGFKKAGLERAKDWLVSADSMAWSFGGRRCEFACPEGKASCANCLHRALEWRAQLLGGLGPEWQRDG